MTLNSFIASSFRIPIDTYYNCPFVVESSTFKIVCKQKEKIESIVAITTGV